MHRADAELAVGADYRLPAELAADGLSEWLDLLAARPADAGPAPLADGQSMHLHATDDGLAEAGEWLVRGAAGGTSWEHGHAKATVAVRGSAADLLLAAMRRRTGDDERVQLFGDAEVWRPGWSGPRSRTSPGTARPGSPCERSRPCTCRTAPAGVRPTSDPTGSR